MSHKHNLPRALIKEGTAVCYKDLRALLLGQGQYFFVEIIVNERDMVFR